LIGLRRTRILAKSWIAVAAAVVALGPIVVALA
jgi:hypothetical protein